MIVLTLKKTAACCACGTEKTKRSGDGGVSFFERVYSEVAKIPYGRVASYSQIARMIGSPRAARQVGWAMRRCPDGLPWHRVVMADGTITGGAFAGRRRAALMEEGVKFSDDGRVDMRACRWDGRPVSQKQPDEA